MAEQSIDLVSRPAEQESLQQLPRVEECVRYYPPDLSPVDDPGAVFRPRPTRRPREIDLFVDVPFCRTICGFCPFNVYRYDAGKVRDYLRALAGEMREITARHDFEDVRIRTVWIGGGTPSVLEESVLDALLELLADNFDLADVDELTVEIKPTLENLADSKLALLQRHSVRRISMGVQSFDTDFLRVLGRGHSAREALDVIRLIRDAGFALNIDMMYRLPGQTPAQMTTDLDMVSTLGLDHLSWFPYVPHEGTSLATRIDRGRVAQQVGREEYLTMFCDVAKRMAAAGFEQYTPYHFGGTDRCRYHIGRWGMPQRETLGLGPGAFSFFNGWIYANEHDPARHAQAVAAGRPPVMRGKRLDETERISRLAVLGIKLFSLGIEEFRAHSGVDLREYYARELDLLQATGMVEIHPDRVECTPQGRAFNNDVATVFATDTARRTRHPQAVELMRAES
ncbi:MAG: coproporphyrinogen-III oxidase family protein [Pseudonocardiaceae bacterium]